MQSNLWLYWIAFVILFSIMIALVCFHKPARKVPRNYILLFIFTLCESYVVAV